MMFFRFSLATRCACFDEICDGRQPPHARRIDAEAQVVERAAEIADAPLLERVLLLRRRERRLQRRHQVVEDDARRQQRADAGQHLQHLERIDVFLAAQQHARAARQDQRVLAEERRDRLDGSRGSLRSRGCGRCAARSRPRTSPTLIVLPMPPTAPSARAPSPDSPAPTAATPRTCRRPGAQITTIATSRCDNAQHDLSRRRRSSRGSRQTAARRNGSVKRFADPEARRAASGASAAAS